MNRKQILTSAVLAALAAGQVHADNRFTVTDSGSGTELMSEKLSEVKQLSFADGKLVVTLADESQCSVKLTTATVLSFEGEASGVSQTVAGGEGLQVRYAGGCISATGLGASAAAAVYSVSGQRVVSLGVWDGSPVSVASLGSGVYVLKVNNKSIKFVKK